MKYSGKTLKKHKSLRPTTRKVKEALFNIIRRKIKNASFLDLYAGTGAVGIEALRAGASEVIFVEESKNYIRNLNKLINRYGLSEKTKIVTKKVLTFIEWAELNQLVFDIIFLDPPYSTNEIVLALSAIGKSNILKQNGIVIAEHFIKRQLPDKFYRLHKTKDYNYGDTVLSVYKSEQAD